MRIILLIIVQTLLSISVFAQNSNPSVEAELAVIKSSMHNPTFIAYELDRRALEYEKLGDLDRSNRLASEALLIRQDAKLPTTLSLKGETLCIQLSDFSDEGADQMRTLLARAEKVKLGCLGNVIRLGAADGMMIYGLHEQAAIYNEQGLGCFKKDPDELFFRLLTLSMNYNACGKYELSLQTLEKAKALAFDSTQIENPFKKRNKIAQAGYKMFTDSDPRNPFGTGIRGSRGNALLALGKLHLLRKDYGAALIELEAAQAFWARLNDSNYQGRESQTFENLALANLLNDSENPESALSFAKQAVFKAKINTIEHVKALRTLGVVYAQLNEVDSAQTAWFKGIAVARETLGKTHPYYARLLGDVSKSFQQKGDYLEALTFQAEASGIADYFFASMNRTPTSQDPVEEIVSFWEANFDQLNGNIVMDRNYYRYRKELYPYEEELTKSINLSDKTNQGIIKMMEGQENEAEELFRNVYEESNQMGLENIMQVPIVFHYARILLKKGNGVLAEQLGKEAAQKAKANYGDVHPIRLLCLHQYAEIQSFQKRNHEAHKLFTEGRNLIRKRQNFVTGYLTENEFLSTRIENEKLLNFQTNFYAALPDGDSIKGNSLFEIASMQKKIALRRYSGLLKHLTPEKKQRLISLRKQRENIRMPISLLGQSVSQEYMKVSEEIQNLEREGIGLTPAQKKGGVYASEVVKLLKPHEAAVEILQVNGKEHNDYYALVIIQGWKSPKVIVMGNSKEMAELLSDENTDLPEKINKVYAIDSRTYQLCWEGIQKALPPTIKTVYLSAAGVYEGLSFAAISGAAGKRVGDNYQIRYVVSTSEIAEKNLTPSKTTTSRSALLLGNVLYSCPESPRAITRPLPFNGAAVAYVDSLIKKAKAKSTLLHQSAATENSLAGLDLRSYDIIHFATHGDFTNRKPDDLKSSRKLTIYQNSEAFLRLAASDCAKMRIKQKSEDGILTATEITSYMDLNAELVVLSACNSAIGTTQGSEGMFGLFRAFKSAGVKKVIATLWEVDDKRTAEFMKYFYANLFKPSATVESAFETTQLFVRKSLGWTPYEYGGLVLLN